MPVNLSVKNVPESLAVKLRERAARNHRSLQGELMAILESAASDPNVSRANAGVPGYEVESGATSSGGLMQRLAAIAGNRGIDTTKRLTREQSHERKTLRKAGT
jgi:plasmid stability protein